MSEPTEIIQENSTTEEKTQDTPKEVQEDTNPANADENTKEGSPSSESQPANDNHPVDEASNPNVPDYTTSEEADAKQAGSSTSLEKTKPQVHHDQNCNVVSNGGTEKKDGDDDESCTPIPGSYGSTIRHGIEMLRLGHHYFVSRMKKFQSCAFKVNMFGAPFVAITDHQGTQCLFDAEKFEKEPAFGNFRLNKELVDNHIPSMFRNGEEHRKQKAFLMALSKDLTLKKLLPVAMRIIPEHLSKWQFKKNRGTNSQEQWEDKILLLTSDIMSEAVLGSRQDGQCFLDWRWQVLKPSSYMCGRPSKAHIRAAGALENLRETVADCPNIDKIVEEAAKHGINEEEAIMDVLWMINFNAAPGTAAVIRSAVARISTLSEEDKSTFREEITKCLGSEGLNYKTLKQMKTLDHFILEVLRMHPPVALYFGVSKTDTVIKTKTGTYKVEAGQKVLGSCHLAQRDPSVFSNSKYKDPEQFDHRRFQEKGMKKKLLFSHGLYAEKPTPDNHACAGRTCGILLVKLFVMYLIMFCDWELEEKPYWTDRSLKRYGNPDEPVRLKNFNYTRDKGKLLIADDEEDQESSSDESYDSRVPESIKKPSRTESISNLLDC